MSCIRSNAAVFRDGLVRLVSLNNNRGTLSNRYRLHAFAFDCQGNGKVSMEVSRVENNTYSFRTDVFEHNKYISTFIMTIDPSTFRLPHRVNFIRVLLYDGLECIETLSC